MDALMKQPLAFTSGGEQQCHDSDLIPASSRLVVEIKDNNAGDPSPLWINVEIFEFAKENKEGFPSESSQNFVLVIPGICESAETKGVQSIVQQAKATALDNSGDNSRRADNITVAVMELEGHGLSTGTKGLCTSFDRLVNQVVETLYQVVDQLYSKSQQVEQDDLWIYLLGNSLGGALAIYAAQQISSTNNTTSSSRRRLKISGIVPIAPAVGMNPRMIPPSVITYALRGMAWMAPSTQLSLTPYEDPTHYNCPSTTTRNYSGNWPLGTSKMLLDVTSRQIPNDTRANQLTLNEIPNLLVIAGQTDTVVPLPAIESFYQQTSCPGKKEIFVVPKAGHDLLFRSESAKQITKKIFDDWMTKIVQQQQQQQRQEQK